MYSLEERELLFDKILLEIEKGRALRTVLKDDGMPNATTFYRWIDEESEWASVKNKQYARASEIRAEKIFDEMLDIADDNKNDINTDEEGREKVNQDNIQRARLKIDARKWVLGKLNPKKFGDKLDMTSDGEKLGTYMLVTNLYDKPKGD